MDGTNIEWAEASLGFPPAVRAGELGRWPVTMRLKRALPRGARLAMARRWPSDWGLPQAGDPAAPDFATVAASNQAPLRWWCERLIPWHPFDHAIIIELLAPMAAGDVVTFQFGATPGPGARAQSFIEEASPLSIRIAPTGEDWREIARPGVRVVGSAPARLVATAPSHVAPGETFDVHVRVEDKWGNPASDVAAIASIGAAKADLASAGGSWVLVRTKLDRPGIHRLTARAGDFSAETNPISCGQHALRAFWGDIHAQSVVGCGARSVEAFYKHARDFGRADFASHQANCFLVSNPEWRETEDVSKALNEPGRFVTLLGVEWSGTRAVGGDHNLYFPGDSAPITRCSHQHVDDKSDVATDLPHITDVHKHYRGSDTIVAVHVGGRSADLQWHEPSIEKLLEVHSTHATSEWFLFEALKRGQEYGVIAGSDSVDGRPGASHPGHLAVRNVRGGLAAFMLPALSRDHLWKAMKARACYGTTGERILLDFAAGPHPMGASVTGPLESFQVSIAGTAPLAAIEFFRGTEIIARAPIAPVDPTPSRWVRVAWRGLTLPGTWDRARMIWHGALRVAGGRIVNARGWAFDTADEGITGWTDSSVRWRSVTGGDWDGVEMEIDGDAATRIDFATAPLTMSCRLADLDRGPLELAARDPERELRVERLPAAPCPRDWSGAFRDAAPPPGRHAYWLRVRQDDGAMAWSTPIFVTHP